MFFSNSRIKSFCVRTIVRESNPGYVLEKPSLLPILMKNLHTKCCTNNYVISHVKRLSSPAICSGSSAFNFRKNILN